MSKEANSLDHDFYWSFQKIVDTIQKDTSTTPIDSQFKQENTKSEGVVSTQDAPTKKRPISEVTDMDINQQQDNKRSKILIGDEIIDIDQLINQEMEMPITFIEEEVIQQETES